VLSERSGWLVGYQTVVPVSVAQRKRDTPCTRAFDGRTIWTGGGTLVVGGFADRSDILATLSSVMLRVGALAFVELQVFRTGR
jgi:hypothetical protein